MKDTFWRNAVHVQKYTVHGIQFTMDSYSSGRKVQRHIQFSYLNAAALLTGPFISHSMPKVPSRLHWMSSYMSGMILKDWQKMKSEDMAIRMMPRLCSSICFLVKVRRGLCTKFLMSWRPLNVLGGWGLGLRFSAQLWLLDATSIICGVTVSVLNLVL